MKQMGLDLGYAAADQAAQAAGSEWSEEAFNVFKNYAKDHWRFTTEQVRYSAPGLRDPRDLRAWGAVALRARKEGLVVFRDWARAETPTVHGSVISLWESTSYVSLG